mgnify:CR=1 FL=1
MSRASLKKKTKKIKTSLRKSGIKTLQDVLNTSILSNDAKIKYIRHQFTCYEKYTKFFYRDNEGLALRKELNKCIQSNWSYNSEFGTRESIFQNYYIFFDEGIEVRYIGKEIYNIIFKINRIYLNRLMRQ